MGTKLKLTNTANNKTVEVVVNDRGPFVKGRDISVTRRAARELGFIQQGLAKVRIEKVP
jgi:rare lipoprotein A